jgi:hypothetical protein
MAEQAFLSSYIMAAQTSNIDVSVLDCSFFRTGISMGMMPAIAIPATLLSMIQAAPHSWPQLPVTASNELLSKHPQVPKERERDRDHHRPKEREPGIKCAIVVTWTVPPFWKATVDNGNQFFSLSSSLGLLDALLKCPPPGVCRKLLLRGRCIQSSCPWGNSQAIILALDPTQTTAFDEWFNMTCHDLKMS